MLTLAKHSRAAARKLHQVPRATLLLPRNVTGSACPHTPQTQLFMPLFRLRTFPDPPSHHRQDSARDLAQLTAQHLCPRAAHGANPQGISLCSQRAPPSGHPLRCHHHPTLLTRTKATPMSGMWPAWSNHTELLQRAGLSLFFPTQRDVSANHTKPSLVSSQE